VGGDEAGGELEPAFDVVGDPRHSAG
jgi:hypothetical protein